MGIRLRLTVEYDPDWVLEDKTTAQISAMVKEEKNSWLAGEVNVLDVLTSDCNPTFSLVNI